MIIYLVGCVLCYGRITGEEYGLEEKYLRSFAPTKAKMAMRLSLSSWFGFAVGVVIYLAAGSEYFFKWSKGDLWEKWFEMHLEK